MNRINLFEPIENLPKINPKILAKLKKIGINQIKDLLYHFPTRYEDFSKITKIKNLEIGRVATIQGRVLNIQNIRTFKKRMILTEALIEDDTSNIIAIWFNQPFLTRNIKKNDIVNLAGKVTMGSRGVYISNPTYEVVSKLNSKSGSMAEDNDGWEEAENFDYAPVFKETTHTGRLVPIYPETRGLTSRWLRFLIKPLLNYLNQLSDILPVKIKKNQRLPDLQWALRNIHFPNNENEAKLAKYRLAFEELFLLQLLAIKRKKQIKSEKSNAIKLDIDLIKKFIDSLPFKLTNAQKKSAWQILQDLSKPSPMNRLLEGDVGSGKTIVALIAAFILAKNDLQTAFMVPTEILAQQHFKTFTELLKNFGVNIALLTSGMSKFFDGEKVVDLKKKQIIEKIKNNEIQIIVGTHSLIAEKKSDSSGKIKFNNLGLAIIDEQHRFGVHQRAKLLNMTDITPHLLSMTATPIPRTLTLTIYGDLDISIIDELPKGRKKIITKIISPSDRESAYNFIEKEVSLRHKVFVICPRIETNNKKSADVKKISQQKLLWQEVKAVKEEYEKLSKQIFPNLKIGMLHGKLKSQEKEQIMNAFANTLKSGDKIDILVSTSVVEVGVDIKNATVMMIESAERFGLAQLHQFRGRIGRGEHQSYCLLFTNSDSSAANQRLKAMLKCENGFELAQKDLEIRGPGDFLGSHQWGLPDLTMASLADLPLIKKVRDEAEKLLEKDSELKTYPQIKEKLKEYKKEIHFE